MSSLKVVNSNNIKIYAVSGHGNTQSIPDWLEKKNYKKLSKDLEWRKRIQLIQDFEFSEASYKIKTSKDQNYCIATGTYQPKFNVYELNNLALKYERYTIIENIDFMVYLCFDLKIFSEDYSKIVFLQRNKSIEFHNPEKMYHRVKLPKEGRQLSYNETNCDLMVVGSANEIYRFNLEKGRYMRPYETSFDYDIGINCIDTCSAHNLIGVGSEDGKLEFFDPRVRQSIACLQQTNRKLARKNIDQIQYMITSLKFHDDGLRLAVGDSTGYVSLYDLRQRTPYLQKDHQYSLPIKKIQWINSSLDKHFRKEKIASCDSKILKLWDCLSGDHFTSVEPTADINDFEILNNSGLVMFANEGPPMQTYYIPKLGPAPRWCSFLDNLTEELEESKNQTIYSDYKFVTYKELEELNLENLIGTEILRAYMHGFLLDLRLYEKAKELNSIPNIEEYKQSSLLKEKIQRRYNMKRNRGRKIH